MTLMPVYGAPYGGSKTVNPAGERILSGIISGTNRDMMWGGGSTLRVLAQSGSTARIYELNTPINYRLSTLELEDTTTLTASVGGSPDFYGFDTYSSSFIAVRTAGTGETTDHVEKYNSSGVATQKFDLGSVGNGGSVRLVSGTKLFYQNDNVIYERTLSVAGDLTTAGSATAHTLAEVSTSVSNGFDFNTSGTRMYVIDNDVHEYSFSSYNIGSASYIGAIPYDSLGFGPSAVGNVAFAQSDELTLGSSTIKTLAF